MYIIKALLIRTIWTKTKAKRDVLPRWFLWVCWSSVGSSGTAKIWWFADTAESEEKSHNFFFNFDLEKRVVMPKIYMYLVRSPQRSTLESRFPAIFRVEIVKSKLGRWAGQKTHFLNAFVKNAKISRILGLKFAGSELHPKLKRGAVKISLCYLPRNPLHIHSLQENVKFLGKSYNNWLRNILHSFYALGIYFKPDLYR
jgi:hypothetical protein